jgi:hypothetical protein
VTAGDGPVEQVPISSLRVLLQDWPNALQDVDGEPLLDIDFRPIYEPGAILDNPTTSVRTYDTVADMVAEPRPWTLDRVVTLNWSAGDGNLLHWTMVAAPNLVPNPDTILEAADSYGFFLRIPTS